MRKKGMQKKSKELLAQVQKIIEEYDSSLSLRQIYYRLVAAQIMSNLQKNYRKLSRLCVIGRDEGLLNEDSFVDRLREIQVPSMWANLNEYMETVRDAYRKNYWLDQPCYLEIWSEKDALRGIMAPVADKYGVPLLIVRGQVSRTAIYEAYERYKANEDKECLLYYFGDHDPSGLCIYRSLVERLGNFNGGLPIKFQRAGLTPEQIKTYRLPQDPAKKSDPNYKKFVAEYGDNVVELDALPPEVLKDLIEDCVVSCIDEDKWGTATEIEQEENAQLQELSF